MYAQTRTERLFASLDAFEVSIVARALAATERLRLERVAVAATRLGNGWLYPIATLLLIAAARIDDAPRFVLSAGSSLAVAFVVYPILKRLLARMRPCDYAPSLARVPEPIDHYSCPSGHTMTAAAYGVSMIAAAPALAPLAFAIAMVIGWSRVALGHHYVTDVVGRDARRRRGGVGGGDRLLTRPSVSLHRLHIGDGARCAECRSMRAIYSWNEGSLKRVGEVSDAHLRAWEYEVATDTAAPAGSETVRLWKTRRPDLAPPELWVGDTEH